MRRTLLLLLVLVAMPQQGRAASYTLTDALIQFLAQVDVAFSTHAPVECKATDRLTGPYSFPNEQLLMDGWPMACTTILTCVAARLETKGL